MWNKFIAPEYELKSFTCPHCWVFSKQEWNENVFYKYGKIFTAICDHCEDFSVWHLPIHYTESHWRLNWEVKMIFPKATWIPLPNGDLEQEIQDDYLEASNIVSDSPRWACALLRLALQKLMIQLWESGKNIDSDIGNLVSNGLNPTIQQALDTVRVIWNESVHPWEIDMKDNIEVATQLFWLINIIAEFLITQPKKIAELYWTLPQGKLEWIQNRDNNS